MCHPGTTGRDPPPFLIISTVFIIRDLILYVYVYNYDHVDAMSSKIRTSTAAGDVLDILKGIQVGKAAGVDNLAAEHFVYSPIALL